MTKSRKCLYFWTAPVWQKYDIANAAITTQNGSQELAGATLPKAIAVAV